MSDYTKYIIKIGPRYLTSDGGDGYAIATTSNYAVLYFNSVENAWWEIEDVERFSNWLPYKEMRVVALEVRERELYTDEKVG